MSGNGLLWLPTPKGRYLRAVASVVETEEEAWHEAETREESLDHAGWNMFGDRPNLRDELRECACSLSDRFYDAKHAEVALPSLAHPVWMRERRLALGAACHRASDKLGALDTVATIMPGEWGFSPSQLRDVNPKQLMWALYMMLYRHGAKDAGGFLLAVLHGEYDETIDRIWLHVHCWLGGEMVDVLDKLRSSQKLTSQQWLVDGRKEKRRPIWIKRKPLTERPKPYTYVLQSFWPSRNFRDESTGLVRRGGRKRIPEPTHTEVLLWLDRWTLTDISFKIGLKTTSRGVSFTRRM